MMDALEFARERRRMCKALNENCKLCELREVDCLIGYSRSTEEDDKRVIVAVEEWSKEHPIKTRQTELLKLFPNTEVDEMGVVKICPAGVGAICPKEGTCSDCRAKWWGEEIEFGGEE